MSLRLIKILLAVIIFHAGVLSLVWVGFPVPPPRPQADFVFVGASVYQEERALKPPLPEEFKAINLKDDSALGSMGEVFRAVVKPKAGR